MTGALCGTSYSGKTFEAHITVEPVEGDSLSEFKRIASKSHFRVAKLLMVKDRKITNQRSDKDSFCTGWGDDFLELQGRTVELVSSLQRNDFIVWRYKIEQTLVDMRIEV